MKGIQSAILGLMLAILLSVSASPVRADDGHDRDRGDFHGGYSHGYDRGGDFLGFRREGGEDWGDGRFRRDEDRGWQRGFIFDRRYHHDRYYPPRGYISRFLPPDFMTFDYDDSRYYFGNGIWYIDNASGYLVVTPPYGIVVPVLPPYYTTIRVGGMPYYYADGVYYVWRPSRQGYVVSPPPNRSNPVSQPQNPDQLYVYPEKGQSAKRQARDRYECHHWAVNQTGYDPSLPSPNLTGSQLITKQDDYRRAIEACLDARGYSVK